MIGDKYKVKHDCTLDGYQLTKGTILTEKEAYNFEKECYEDGGEYNEIRGESGYLCDAGSAWAKENLEKINDDMELE